MLSWQGCAIPSAFKDLQNFNHPEVQLLATGLMSSYWQQEKWCDLELTVNKLLTSISKYTQELHSYNEQMTSAHRSPTPVREVYPII